MRILVATTTTQGRRSNDFNWCLPSEPVVPNLRWCGRHGHLPVPHEDDDNCGCRRSFAGLVSHRATTTARVSDTGSSDIYWKRMLGESLGKAGHIVWKKRLSADDQRIFDEEWDAFSHVADNPLFPEGSVVEFRDSALRRRENYGQFDGAAQAIALIGAAVKAKAFKPPIRFLMSEILDTTPEALEAELARFEELSRIADIV